MSGPRAFTRITLLGGFSIEPGPMPGYALRRLLALLAIEERPLLRGDAAYHLWGYNADPDQRLANLRHVIVQARRELGEVVVVDRHSIRLHPSVAVDLWEVRRALTRREIPMEMVPSLRLELLPDWRERWLDAPRARWDREALAAQEVVEAMGPPFSVVRSPAPPAEWTRLKVAGGHEVWGPPR